MKKPKVVEELETHILCPIFPLPPENRAVYEVKGKNVLERGRTQMTTWHMCSACWIP